MSKIQMQLKSYDLKSESPTPFVKPAFPLFRVTKMFICKYNEKQGDVIIVMNNIAHYIYLQRSTQLQQTKLNHHKLFVTLTLDNLKSNTLEKSNTTNIQQSQEKQSNIFAIMTETAQFF